MVDAINFSCERALAPQIYRGVESHREAVLGQNLHEEREREREREQAKRERGASYHYTRNFQRNARVLSPPL